MRLQTVISPTGGYRIRPYESIRKGDISIMEKSYSASYAAAGVDITAGYRSVELMKQYVARTMTENCIGGLGGFGGLFELDCTGIIAPVWSIPS